MVGTGSIEWSEGTVRFINQAKLPDEEEIVETSDYRRIADSIRRLEIRGAPAIGIAAAFGIVLAVWDDRLTPEEYRARFQEAWEHLSKTRPTAVNLFASLGRMKRAFEETAERGFAGLREALLGEALVIQREEIDACLRIGQFGAGLINPGSNLLTHCNTGRLATGGEGTAQSVIVTAFRQGKVRRVYVDETRPLLQGARLTAWELSREKIEVVLITDSTAGYLMQVGKVDAVVVGADRIAANGDVANKIGTYSLAVLAAKHGVPFYVAAPLSTFDPALVSGSEIPIEERDPMEVTHVGGNRVAAKGINAFAPAFDVTGHELITAIITDCGIIQNPTEQAVGKFLQKKKAVAPVVV
jgi:methylthioribose-1-phosphate isomerase